MTESNWSEWASLGKGDSFGEIGVGVNEDGRLEVFAVTTDGALKHNHQRSPGGSWSGWGNLSPDQTISGGLAIGENLDGRIEVLGISWFSGFISGNDRTIRNIHQIAPNKEWSMWGTMGAPPETAFSSQALGRNRDGRLEVFALALDGSAWHKWQNRPNSDWSNWRNLNNPAGKLQGLAVERDSEGFLQVFAVAEDGTVWNISQTGNKWDWKPLGAATASFPTLSISVGRNDDGRLELFATSAEGNVWHNYQKRGAPGQATWSGWTMFGKPTDESLRAVVRIPAILNQNDALQIFVLDNAGSVWTRSQNASGAPDWGNWLPLGSPNLPNIVDLAVARNHDARLELFALTRDGEVAHVGEVEQSKLQWFKTLVARVAPIVYMHPDETFMPSSFEWYLQRTRYVDANGNDQGPLTPALVEEAPHGENGFLAYPWNDDTRNGDLRSAVCYAHVIAEGEQAGFDVQYWFFSPFNGAGIIGLTINALGQEVPATFSVAPLGEHEGDWEHIVVRVDRDGRIQRIYLSAHSGGEWFNHQASEPGSHDGFTLQDGHPVVYSALNGHPSFPWVGSFPTKTPSGTAVGFNVETGPISAAVGLLNQAGQGPRWDCYRRDHHKLLAIDTPDFTYSSNTWWLPFRGRVGAQKPSIGDTEQEAVNRLAGNLGGLALLGAVRLLLIPLALAIVQALILAAPFVDNPSGPESLILKDEWFRTPI